MSALCGREKRCSVGVADRAGFVDQTARRNLSRPLITFVLPTRNRPSLVRQAVNALIQQSYSNLEIVVVDNSDDDETRTALASCRDPRLRVQATGGLNMPENWEEALAAGSGSYVVLVNDKTIFKKDAAERLFESMHGRSEPFLTFVIGKCGTSDGAQPSPTVVDNAEVVRHALDARIDLYQRLAPRGTNMIVRRDWLCTVKERYGLLCRPVSPDYSLSTFLLESNPTSLHLSEVLAEVIPQAPSNTHLVQDKPRADEGYFKTLGLREEEFFSHVPLNVFLVNNLLLNDVLKTLEVTRGRKLSADKKEYYLSLFSDLIILRAQNRPYREQARQVRRALGGESTTFKCRLAKFAFSRFRHGWPNRQLKMRHNARGFLAAARLSLLGR